MAHTLSFSKSKEIYRSLKGSILAKPVTQQWLSK